MSFPTHDAMHEAHIQWQKEHGAWLADIDRWQTETRAAIEEMQNVEALLRAHGDALRAHAKAIDAHGDGLQRHAVALAELEQGGLTDRREGVIGQHFSQLGEHTQQMVCHALLARHHGDVLEQLRRLVQVLRASLPRLR